jgi:protein gp37
VSATDHHQYLTGLRYLREVTAPIRGFSFEPLLRKIDTSYDTLDWVILGSQTQPIKHPSLENVQGILENCRQFNTPVFIKEPLASYIGIQRQEFPTGANTHMVRR